MSVALNELKDYAASARMAQVLLHVTHSNLQARMFEIRLDRHMSVGTVKEKLRTHTGYFSPLDGYTLHITDLDPHSLSAGGGLEDVNLVKNARPPEGDRLEREESPALHGC
ncbi:hypothetical protein EMIHUDRAFT_193900 [Emiliania huxleyi CCMP1516]|uniref:Ubiquitin-like domain-containing protein n=2 Tax=Emiliania huxleyi TaxID=2903 RepID=A0A0D3L0L4_EMIH1|nr:hypothetical protein EMIHUDRAFT_193900 [Emiliania huxleyi CCMP1516]EOD41549.1 hypothetical protein EMIHUDRAFT_193900 [Emiliania huxleyi CCMP1516]|eukprot:XP_005793978.1 hypothetical protein EMIHUDRAFT_193900 [Emiliania huxleyi CCMP1516]